MFIVMAGYLRNAKRKFARSDGSWVKLWCKWLAVTSSKNLKMRCQGLDKAGFVA